MAIMRWHDLLLFVTDELRRSYISCHHSGIFIWRDGTAATMRLEQFRRVGGTILVMSQLFMWFRGAFHGRYLDIRGLLE